MATMTLLDMTQNILSAMESDSINSLGDTVESTQVAEFIKETYFDIISNRDWPFLKSKTTLSALGDTLNPTKMKFPNACDKVYWIKYNKKDVAFMDQKQFQDMIDLRVAQTGVINANGFVINQDPLFWTSFDDTFVIFDAYNAAVDTTLQASKSQVFLLRNPTWSLDNNFVPELPDKMFPMLLADAKGSCFLNMKQVDNKKEERKAQRLKVRMAKESIRNNEGEDKYNTSVNFGRNSGPSTRFGRP